MVVFDTKIDHYIQIVIVVMVSLTFLLYLQDCVGTINDYLNGVVFMGSGAPIDKVFVLVGLMLATSLINIVVCFLPKTK